MHAGARAEWDRLHHVVMHEPGIEVFFALLAPLAHLYERFFTHAEARREHRELVRILSEDFSVHVDMLDAAILDAAGRDLDLRQQLVDLAERRLQRICEAPASACLPARIEAELTSTVALRDRDNEHLLGISVLNPVLTITPAGIATAIGQPLYNLYFMRDQQAATDNGIVAGKMATQERTAEVDLCGIGLNALGVSPVHRVEQGSFEGGDFIPAGEFALIGCGFRSNRDGVNDLIRHALSFDEVAVVHEPDHPLIGGKDPMVAMHLDTYVNFAAEGVAVGSPLLLEKAQVDVYARSGEEYVPLRSGVNLRDYLAGRGFDIVEISTLEQLCYASNFLCVRSGECVAPDTALLAPLVVKRLREKALAAPGKYDALLRQAETDYRMLSVEQQFFPRKKTLAEHGIEMVTTPLTHATGGYGGAHCMTCVISR